MQETILLMEYLAVKKKKKRKEKMCTCANQVDSQVKLS